MKSESELTDEELAELEDWLLKGAPVDGGGMYFAGVASRHDVSALFMKIASLTAERDQWKINAHNSMEIGEEMGRASGKREGLEMAAALADNYGRDGRLSKEYACETADEIAARIRALKEGN